MNDENIRPENMNARLDGALAQAAQNQEAATPPAPEQQWLTRLAQSRARALKQSTASRRRGVPRSVAALVAALAFISVLIIHLLPDAQRAGLSEGAQREPAMITPAWAATDGSVIEFTVPYDSWDDYPDYSSPLHPRQAVSAAVDAWLAQHADLQSEIPRLPLANVSMSFISMEDPAPVVRVQVSVALTDSALVNDLADLIASRTGYAAPVVDSRTVYFSSEYPDLVAAGVKAHIDDRTYDFPNDFTPDEAFYVDMMLGGRTYYSGHGGYEIGRRFGDCAVFKVETSAAGDLVITTIAQELDAEPKVLDMLRHSSAMYEPDPEDLAHPWRDPVLELIREGRITAWSFQDRDAKNEDSIDVEAYSLFVWLVPEDRWQQLLERQQALTDKGREVLPELTAADWLAIEEETRRIEEQTGPEKLAEYGETALEMATKRYIDARAINIDAATRMSPAFRSFPELSEKERAQAEALAAALREGTKQWYAEYAAEVYETSPSAELNREVRTVGDVPVWFRVWIKCNDPALVADLQQEMKAVDGLIRPLEVKQFTSTARHSEPVDPIYSQSNLAAE